MWCTGFSEFYGLATECATELLNFQIDSSGIGPGSRSRSSYHCYSINTNCPEKLWQGDSWLAGSSQSDEWWDGRLGVGQALQQQEFLRLHTRDRYFHKGLVVLSSTGACSDLMTDIMTRCFFSCVLPLLSFFTLSFHEVRIVMRVFVGLAIHS